MLLAHSKGATEVSLNEILEIAAMPADELRRRTVVGRDWHRLFSKCLDKIPELQLLGGAPDGCWMPRDIRRVVMRLLNKPGDDPITKGEATEEQLSALKVAQISEARRLIGEAVVLLKMAGAAPVAKKAMAAIEAAEKAGKKPRKRPAIRSTASAKSLPLKRSELFRRDGSLRFVAYMKGSGRRPPVVAINFRVPGLQQLTTTFTLTGRDLGTVYDTAVKALAAHIGVDADREMLEAMLSTREAFSKRYLQADPGGQASAV